jgi:hypothetical protein
MRTNTTGSTCDESYAIDDGHAERRDARGLKNKQKEEEEGLHVLILQPLQKEEGFLSLFSRIFPSGRTDFLLVFPFFHDRIDAG